MKNFVLNVLAVILFLAGLAAFLGLTLAYLSATLGFFEDLILSRITLWPRGYQSAVEIFLFVLACAPPLAIVIAVFSATSDRESA